MYNVLKYAQKFSYFHNVMHFFQRCTYFRRYYFYFLPDQAQTHLDHFNVFRRTLVPNFILIRQRVNNFPIDPIVKIARFRQRYNDSEMNCVGVLMLECVNWREIDMNYFQSTRLNRIAVRINTNQYD